MDGNERLVTFHLNLIFPASRWVRSVLIGLAEGGDCVSFDIEAELTVTFGISGMGIIGNSFNWLREKARRDKAEKQAPKTQWQRTMASPFMEAYDKRPMQLSAESETFAPQTVEPRHLQGVNVQMQREGKYFSASSSTAKETLGPIHRHGLLS